MKNKNYFTESSLPTFLKTKENRYLIRLSEGVLYIAKKNELDTVVAKGVDEYISLSVEDTIYIITLEQNKLIIRTTRETSGQLDFNFDRAFSRQLLENAKNISLCACSPGNVGTLYLFAKRKTQTEEKLITWTISRKQIEGPNTLEQGDYILFTSSSFQTDSEAQGHLVYIVGKGENHFVFYKALSSNDKWSSSFLVKRIKTGELPEEPVLVVNRKKPIVFWLAKDTQKQQTAIYTYEINKEGFEKIWLTGTKIIERDKPLMYLCAGVDGGSLWLLWWNDGMEGCIQAGESLEAWNSLTPPGILTCIRFTGAGQETNTSWGQRAYGIVNNLEVYRPMYFNSKRKNETQKASRARRKSREELLEKMRKKYNISEENSAEENNTSLIEKKGIVPAENENENESDKTQTPGSFNYHYDEKNIDQIIEDNKKLNQKIDQLEKKLDEYTRQEDERLENIKNENKELRKQVKDLKTKFQQKESNLRIQKQEKSVEEKDKQIEKLEHEKEALKKNLIELENIKKHTVYLEKANKELYEKQKDIKEGKKEGKEYKRWWQIF